MSAPRWAMYLLVHDCLIALLLVRNSAHCLGSCSFMDPGITERHTQALHDAVIVRTVSQHPVVQLLVH